MTPHSTPIITRATLLLLALTAATQLAGCTEGQLHRFFERLVEALLIALLIGLVVACFALVIFLLEVALLVANLVRPTAFTAMTAMVVGGGQLLLSAVSVAAVLSGAITSPDAIALQRDVETVLQVLGSALVYGIFNSLLIGSGWHAWRQLAMQRLADDEEPSPPDPPAG